MSSPLAWFRPFIALGFMAVLLFMFAGDPDGAVAAAAQYKTGPSWTLDDEGAPLIAEFLGVDDLANSIENYSPVG